MSAWGGPRASRAVARTIAIAIGASIAASLAPSLAGAQSPSETALARQAFRDGVVASRQERWDEAVDSFQRSFELAPRPLTMMNLAGALAQTGRLVEAAEAYRSFLTMARTGRDARLRDEAERQLRELEGRIPRVRLRVLGRAEGDVLRLDEYELGSSALDLPVAVDPGEHTVTIVRDGQERSLPFGAAEGVAQEVVIDARPEAWGTGSLAAGPGVGIGEGGAPGGGGTGGGGGGSVLEEPWLWIVVGAVVVSGIAIGVGVGVASQSPGPPYQGNVGPGGLPL